MSCSPFDLRDYWLQELAEAQRREVEAHLRGCTGCQEELQQLQLTGSALLTLRDEEMPQRIAFVSDKIFEPSPLARWWAAFWGSGARLGFASAAMLSVALIVSSLVRQAPAPAPQPVANTAPPITAAQLQAELAQRVNEAVAKAVAETEARQDKKTAALLAAAEKRYEMDRKGLVLAMDENLDFMRKRMNRLVLAANDMGSRP